MSVLLTCVCVPMTAQGKYDEAEELLRRALEINEKVYGPEHPDVATDLNMSTTWARCWPVSLSFLGKFRVAVVVGML